jgi:hypothetical protein
MRAARAVVDEFVGYPMRERGLDGEGLVRALVVRAREELIAARAARELLGVGTPR